MTDLEKAKKVKAEYEKFTDWGYNSYDASHNAIRDHNSGYETGEHQEVIIAYCGEYLVNLCGGRGYIYKKVID